MAVRRPGNVAANFRIAVGGSSMTKSVNFVAASRKFHRDLQKKLSDKMLLSRSNNKGYISAGPA